MLAVQQTGRLSVHFSPVLSESLSEKPPLHVSLSRLNHGQPVVQAHPDIVQGATEVPHEITDALLPQAASVFDAAPALDTALDMVAPQSPLVELLVRHVLLPREFLPQIGINSIERHRCTATIRVKRAMGLVDK